MPDAKKDKKKSQEKARKFIERLFGSKLGSLLPGAQANQAIEKANRDIQTVIGKKAKKKAK